MNIKPLTLLAGLAWVNWFALTWIIVLDLSSNYVLSGLAWLFFLLVALAASFSV